MFNNFKILINNILKSFFPLKIKSEGQGSQTILTTKIDSN
jgi:hypothetical protein